MHRINLRGPWQTEQILLGIALKRNFNLPSNLADGQQVFLHLLGPTALAKFYVNNVALKMTALPRITPPALAAGSSAPVAANAEADASACGSQKKLPAFSYRTQNVIKLLLPSNTIRVELASDANNASLQPGQDRTISVSPMTSNPLLIDAWLEIIDPPTA